MEIKTINGISYFEGKNFTIEPACPQGWLVKKYGNGIVIDYNKFYDEPPKFLDIVEFLK